MEFLTVAPPFETDDVFPWRFNRRLSYMRRPLLIRRDESGADSLVWGIRHTYEAGIYLFGMCWEGRLRASSTQLRQWMGHRRNRAGAEFNASVTEVIRLDRALTVRANVRRFGDRQIARDSGEPLGDVDVLVADPRSRTLVAIEAKNLTGAGLPHQIANELSETFQSRGRRPASVQIHAERVEWLRKNLPDVLEAIDLASHDASTWKVRGLVVVDREVLSAFLTECPFPVVPLWTVASANSLMALL